MVTQETARKYEVVEDLPGVGPSTADKLKELGFHTIESLATATVRELVPAGIGEKQAAKIIAEARVFFSSRRRHTRLQGDWSSDVCSSDLVCPGIATGATGIGPKDRSGGTS